MNNTLYIKSPMPRWMGFLIPRSRSKDEITVLDTKNNLILIEHKNSGYKGWLNKIYFTENKNQKQEIKEIKKIVWEN